MGSEAWLDPAIPYSVRETGNWNGSRGRLHRLTSLQFLKASLLGSPFHPPTLRLDAGLSRTFRWVAVAR